MSDQPKAEWRISPGPDVASAPPVSRVVPPGPRPRLQELARAEADRLHDEAFRMSWAIEDETLGHREPFETCPHTDCLLVRAAEAERETARQQLHEAQDELEAMKLDEAWTPAEHQRAMAAMQQSEGLDATHCPSFRERVWWKAFESECNAARQQLADLIADLRESLQYAEDHGIALREALKNVDAGAVEQEFRGILRVYVQWQHKLSELLARHAGKE